MTKKASLKIHADTMANDEAQADSVHGDRYEAIAEAAYFRAEARGFAPGGEMDDWLGAESELGAG